MSLEAIWVSWLLTRAAMSQARLDAVLASRLSLLRAVYQFGLLMSVMALARALLPMAPGAVRARETLSGWDQTTNQSRPASAAAEALSPWMMLPALAISRMEFRERLKAARLIRTMRTKAMMIVMPPRSDA